MQQSGWEMTGCILPPDEFNRQLLEAGKQHKRIGVIKFWNMCCVQCSSRPPIAIVLSELSNAQLMAAHGVSCERTVVLLSKVLPEDNKLLLSIKRIVPKYQVDVETMAYAKKLSDLYNTLGPIDNGNVIHLISKDQEVYKVVLQAVVFVP